MQNNISDSSDDSSSNSDEIDEVSFDNRAKRSTFRNPSNFSCGNSSNTTRIVWPPPQSSSNWRQLRHVPFGNPQFGTKMQLYSRTKHHLAIYPDGTVRGTPDENDLHTYLELISTGYPGHVRIKGLLTNLYVAMDHKGRLYGEPDMNNERTVFIESFQGSYSAYLSRYYAHLGWTMQNIPGNPDLSNRMRLYCEHGYNLTIRHDGLVLGTTDDTDTNSVLEITTGGDVALVRIRGVDSQRCLCFDPDGHLYGEEDPDNDGTVFEEKFQGSYTGYRSVQYPDWFVGIKKNGEAKNGKRTQYGQKAVRFLPRRC